VKQSDESFGAKINTTLLQLTMEMHESIKKFVYTKLSQTIFWTTKNITMATLDMITEAIAALKDSKGSTVPAITKWIESEKDVSFFVLLGFALLEWEFVLTNPAPCCFVHFQVDVKKRALTQILKKGTESGVLVKNKDVYSLAPEGGDSSEQSEEKDPKDAKKAAAAEKKAAAAAEKEAKKAAAAAEKEAKKAAAAAAKEEKKKAAAEKKAAAAAAKAAKKKEKE
jgi:linker histone H1 and H5 family